MILTTEWHIGKQIKKKKGPYIKYGEECCSFDRGNNRMEQHTVTMKMSKLNFGDVA